MSLGREDLYFLVNSSQQYVSTGGKASALVDMAQSFESVPRSTKDLSNYSVIANYTSQGQTPPQGVLSLMVCNANGSIDSKGNVTFTGSVDWVLKSASIINVGGQDADGNLITPPFDISMPFNCYQWMKISYAASQGDGIFYAKIGGVEI